MYVTSHLQELLKEKDAVRIVVGSAPSQDEFFEWLTASPFCESVDWSRVTVFHMDEYVGLAADHPQSFRAYQSERFVSKVGLKAFHEVRAESASPEKECQRLSSLLEEAAIDLVCAGIGENGHLAFNDPAVADFQDPEWVKVVELDEACRQQQVNDGCFPRIEEVPRRAITLTLRVFANARKISCVVPAETKSRAVAATLYGTVDTRCPATLMRNHRDARMFLDQDSSMFV